MLNSKSNVRNIGDILGKIPSSFTFQDPPLADVPYTTISKLNGDPRQIPDLTKTLKPSFGIEPILATSPVLLKDEVGPNGERVFAQQDFDPRVRFVGSSWSQESDAFGATVITTGVNNYVEITFWGTGLVWLTLIDATTRDIRVTIDNGAESADIFVEGSSVLNNRNYRTHQKIRLTPTPLTLGWHTAKIRFVASNNLRYYGVEVLNESSQIKIPQGEIFSNGLKYTNPTLISDDYNTGFDGNPVLNGKGGRVLQYLSNSKGYGKAIQQASSLSPKYGALADHSDEELIDSIDFREYGANRVDDPATLTDTVEDVAFTLRDNSTSLVGDNVRSFSNANFPASNFYMNEINDTGATMTFFGTGLDLIMTFGSASETVTIKVDGDVVGTLTFDTLTQYKLKTVVSGLAVGSHTVSIIRGGPLLSNFAAIHEILIYGPKKPSIPSDAIEIGEYYLLASFDYSNITGTTSPANLKMPKGVLTKAPLREVNYTGTWSVGTVSDIDNDHTHGLITSTTTAADYLEFFFWGTGIEAHLCTSASGTYVATIAIDGVNNASGTVSGNISNSGGGAYTTTSSVIQQPARVVFTGLTLGYHKIRVTRTSGSGSMNVDSFNIICPIHFPNRRTSTSSMGPGVQLKRSEDVAGIDLSKAKAWLKFDGTNSIVLSSYGISGVIRTGTGHYVVYLEKPMRADHYAIVGMGMRYATGVGQANYPSIDDTAEYVKPKVNHFDVHVLVSGLSAQDGIFSVVVFGELADEEESK